LRERKIQSAQYPDYVLASLMEKSSSYRDFSALQHLTVLCVAAIIVTYLRTCTTKLPSDMTVKWQSKGHDYVSAVTYAL